MKFHEDTLDGIQETELTRLHSQITREITPKQSNTVMDCAFRMLYFYVRIQRGGGGGRESVTQPHPGTLQVALGFI